MINLVTHSYFEQATLNLILLYSMLLVFSFDTYLNDDRYTDSTCEYADSILSFLFLLEILMRVIAMGLVSNKNGYLRDPINVIDLILGISIICDYSLELYYLSHPKG